MKEGLTGKAPTAARDGVTNVAPLVGMTAATALPPGTSPRPPHTRRPYARWR